MFINFQLFCHCSCDVLLTETDKSLFLSNRFHFLVEQCVLARGISSTTQNLWK